VYSAPTIRWCARLHPFGRAAESALTDELAVLGDSKVCMSDIRRKP
jgi:hypothetical protein